MATGEVGTVVFSQDEGDVLFAAGPHDLIES